MAHKAYRIDLRPPTDADARRSSLTRFISVLFSSAFLLLAPAIFLHYWCNLLINETVAQLAGMGGLGMGLALLSRIAPSRMFVYNAEWTAYVTQDALMGTMVPYGPGLHLSHWWEVRNKKGNWSLQVITRDLPKIEIATDTAKVMIGGKYEYAINLALIDRAVGIDESTIDIGISAFVESFLTSTYSGKSANEIREDIDGINNALALQFMHSKHDDPTTPDVDERTLEKLGEKYGFTIVSLIIDSFKLPDAVQKTRDAKDEAAQMFGLVATLYGLEEKELKRRVSTGELKTDEYNKMLNRAMAASENATTMTVQVIEGDVGAAAAAVLANMTHPKGGKK